jgi:hypothetical protein
VVDSHPQRTRPRRRWGRRLLITLIVLLVVVGGGLFLIDRFGASFAERRIADRVAQEVTENGARSAPPEVTIGGVPFVTQVLDGRYKEITILLREFAGPAGQGRTVTMPLLDIRARDVRAPLDTVRSGNGQITATTVTGTGTLDYPGLAALANREGVTLGERDGKLTVTGPVQAAGQTFNVNGTADLTVKGNVVQVRFADLTAEGLGDIPLVRNLINAYAKQVSFDIKVPDLPLKLAIQKVEPRPQGLVFTAAADEVPLNSGGI